MQVFGVGGSSRGDLDELHRAPATRAGHHVDREHALEQPRPRMPVRGLRVAGRSTTELGRFADEQPQLCRCGRLGHAARHNLAAGVGVGREHAVIPEHVKVRRWDQGDKPRDEIKRIQQHGVRPISPGVLEAIHQALAIRREGEALLSNWRSRDVPAQPLESTTMLGVVIGYVLGGRRADLAADDQAEKDQRKAAREARRRAREG
jgi:hypothetical protein